MEERRDALSFRVQSKSSLLISLFGLFPEVSLCGCSASLSENTGRERETLQPCVVIDFSRSISSSVLVNFSSATCSETVLKACSVWCSLSPVRLLFLSMCQFSSRFVFPKVCVCCNLKVGLNELMSFEGAYINRPLFICQIVWFFCLFCFFKCSKAHIKTMLNSNFAFKV